jgi:hypothetical protein
MNSRTIRLSARDALLKLRDIDPEQSGDEIDTDFSDEELENAQCGSDDDDVSDDGASEEESESEDVNGNSRDNRATAKQTARKKVTQQPQITWKELKLGEETGTVLLVNGDLFDV